MLVYYFCNFADKFLFTFNFHIDRTLIKYYIAFITTGFLLRISFCGSHNLIT